MYESHQHNDYRDNEEEMHEAAKRIGGNKAQKPENDEDSGDSVQHGYKLDQISLKRT